MKVVRSLGLVLLSAAVLLAGNPAGSAAADTPKTKQQKKKEQRQKLKAALAERDAAKAPPAQAPVPKLAPRPTPVPIDPAELAKLIDARLAARLTEEGVAPSPKASDAEFLRRAYLDLTGVIPTVSQARTFLDDTDPAKRAKLIDALLASPGYGRHLADLWQAKLMPRDSDTRFVQRQPFVDWLARQFNDNVPWDKTVTEIVAATGPVDKNPAVTYFLMNRTVDKLTDGVTQHFLGVRLGCAQCHNHPFTAWKQTEYWGMAAFFSKVQPDRPRNPNQGADNSTIGVRELAVKSRLKDFFPEAAKTVPAKFLGAEEPKLTASEPYRPHLAAWMTGPDNPYFARAMVNRTWAQLFGRGFVNPVDDMHEDNEPSHPDLLDALAHKFARGGFDLKALTKAICLTDAYGRTSKPAAGNEKADAALFARMRMKVMSPEQLFDSLGQVTGFTGAMAKKGGPAPKGQQFTPRDRFVQFYLAGADEVKPTEYDAGIPQALKMMNSRLAGGPQVARQFVRPGSNPLSAVEDLYLATLSRRPTDAERERVRKYLAGGPPAEALGDLLWALLNSSEFAMVR